MLFWEYFSRPLDKSEQLKVIFLISQLNASSFKHPKHMFNTDNTSIHSKKFALLHIMFFSELPTLRNRADIYLQIWVRIIPEFVLLDFSLTVKAAPHECVTRTGLP